jgi:hypothetical protein
MWDWEGFIWQNIRIFPVSRETFCDVYGPQFDTAKLDVMSAFRGQRPYHVDNTGSRLDVMSAFENIFHVSPV